MKNMNLFAVCPRYLEDLLEEEILKEGAVPLRRSMNGISLEASLEQIYSICLNSRIASHLYLLLDEFEFDPEKASSLPDEIYNRVHQFDWDSVMENDTSFACRATIKGKLEHNEKWISLRLKDGIVDYWRDKTGQRPDVDKSEPDLRFMVHVEGRGRIMIYLDLSGKTLSDRGYRLDSSKAGLRENTAAAILLRSGWKEKSSEGCFLLDPLCGSATILVEGAMIAADLPCNLNRSGYGFMSWKGHDPDLWEDVFDRAETRWNENIVNLPLIIGFDSDKKSIAAAFDNIKRAGLEGRIHVEKRELNEFVFTEAMSKSAGGCIVSNPPYGVRLGNKGSLHSLYRALGDLASKPVFAGGRLTLISDDKALLKSVGLRSSRENKIMNGPLSCFLNHYELFRHDGNEKASLQTETSKRELPEFSDEGQQLYNRLMKRKKHLSKVMKREGISCYRLYDADLPNFNFALDFYENRWVHVQEYKAPSSIDSGKADKRLKEAREIIKGVLSIQDSGLFMKQRRKQKGRDQYENLSRRGERFLIQEWNQRIWVNFTDYLDTGIFLDHRKIRRYILENSSGKSVLNLFSYTCTASLMAAAGGASRVVSVDSSRAYLSWGEDNFKLNKLESGNYVFEKKDSFEYLKASRESFDLIFLDPPTFSNSKSRKNVFDIQSDHAGLIRLAMKRLNPGGLLIFSNNFTRFEMDKEIEGQFEIREQSSWTASEDFHRKKSGHRCWFISKRD